MKHYRLLYQLGMSKHFTTFSDVSSLSSVLGTYAACMKYLHYVF